VHVTTDYRRAALADIDPATLYRILWLRLRVFVVEQAAAYPELDGRDLEPETQLLWAEEDGYVVSTLRVLVDDGRTRIGRVATDPSARGRGIAAELMTRALGVCEELRPGAPIDLDAQEQLRDWYGRFGFAVSGPAFVEDDIPHVPMTRG
jgi:ElaA protein